MVVSPRRVKSDSEGLVRPLQQQGPDLFGTLSMGRSLGCYELLVSAFDRSGRVVDIQMFVPRPSSLQLFHNHLRRLLALGLLEPHDLPNESPRLWNRTFPLLLGLGHQGIVRLSSITLGASILWDLLSPPASLDRLSIRTLNCVCELFRIDRTRQNVWCADNQEADSQCPCE
jgi:hypothetical protein